MLFISDTYMKVSMLLSTASGILSLIGSSLLMFTILQSEKKLSVPYRRLLFGISIFDIFQSAGSATGIFSSPEGIGPWSIGNQTTCDVQGFIFIVGASAVPLYLCSLCIYFFCIIRLNIKLHRFRMIEPILYIVPIFYGFFNSIYALENQYINSWGGGCYVVGAPYFCELDRDTECKRGDGAMKFDSISFVFLMVVSALVICTSMTAIVCFAIKTETRNRRYSIPRSSITSNEQVVSSSQSTLRHQRRMVETNSSSRTLEITKQALLYVGSFWLAYGWRLIRVIHTKITGTMSIPLVLLHSFFFPLQGFVNIFIYCRPHIVSLRKRCPGEYTWFRAFKVVLKSGGDSCQVTVAAERQRYRHRQDKKQDKKRLLVDDDFPHEETLEEVNARDIVPVAPDEPPVATKIDDGDFKQKHSTWHWLRSAGRSTSSPDKLPESSQAHPEKVAEDVQNTNTDPIGI